MSVFVDKSAVTFVYGCEECPFWRGVSLSLSGAEDAAIAHEETIHGTQIRRTIRDKREARHARELVTAS